MNHRTLRLLGALTLATSLMATTFIASAVAKPPAGAQATATAIPSQVSAGDTVAFALTFTNNGPSNISSLFLVADNPTGSTFVGVVSGPSVGTCTGVTSLFCSFGTVNVGDPTITLTVVYTSPADVTGSWNVYFHFNSTGTTGGNSHGSDIAAPTGTVTLSNSGDFHGRFATDNFNISDNGALNRNNRQSTAVDASALGLSNFPLQVADGPQQGFDTPTAIYTGSFDCTSVSSLSGEWSYLNVNNDQLLNTNFRATIVQYQGLNPNQINGLCWVYKDLTSGQVVVRALTVADNTCDDPVNPTNAPCLLLNKVGNNLQITFISNHNGTIHTW